MTRFSTSTPENSADPAVFKNPYTGTEYRRGQLQVSVDRRELVSPEANSIMEKQIKHIAATTHPDFPAIIDPTHIACGPFISALGDNLFFDAVLGVGTNGIFGYNHPRIFEKLQKLGSILPGFMGAGTDFFYTSRHGAPAAQDLAESLCAFAREAFGGDYMMNFANAGTEANENALKVAMFRKYRQLCTLLGEESYSQLCALLGIKRIDLGNDEIWSNYPSFILAFKSSFHGRTATSNTISMSKRKQKEGYQSLPYVVHLPYGPEADFEAIIDPTPLKELIASGKVKEIIEAGKVPIDLLSAVIMEPIQGEGGYRIPDTTFLAKLDEFLSKYRSRGVLLVSDEVQTGLFRTGSFTGMQNWFKSHKNLRPDILSFAKPLHVGGVLIDRELMVDWPGGKFSGTWSEGNLLGIAVAYYTLEELRNIDPFLAKPYGEYAVDAGKYMREQLAGMQSRLDKKFAGEHLVENIRGLGQMNAFDVPSAEFVEQIVLESFHHGVHILGTGERSIRIFGTVDQRKREAEMLVSILEKVLESVMESGTAKETKSGALSKS